MFSRRDLLKAGAASLALAGCTRDRGPRNVVVVIIDQLRVDAARTYMPRLNALADQGVRFTQTRSVAPWTYPSVVSMMSGLLPQQHGADGHRTSNLLARFSTEVPTLQKRLKAAGYTTRAWVTNPFLHTWNPFHEGFDAYDISFIGSQGNVRGDAKAVWRPETMYADSVNAAATTVFAAEPATGPELSYFHYIDVHGPWKGAPFDATYEAACRYTDQKVAEIYEACRARYDDHMVFAVISDHGKSIGDDETLGAGRPWRFNKSSPHEFNVRIPFWILGARDMPRGVRVGESVSNVDLTPTLLDWVGLEPTVALTGRSLKPAMLGSALQPLPTYNRMAAFGWRNEAVVHQGRKTIRYFDPDTGDYLKTRAFDLASDPDEATPLADPDRDIAVLDQAASDHGLAYEATFDAVEDGLKSQLQALGYLEDH